ncbi:MAG: hypothetical protein QOK44_1843, partial [Betaproteobacteria bacterium]|nr:hypothetical protein [Betaproteobacteria bacterium]
MLTITPTNAALGAEILGVDLSRDLADTTFNEIVAAFHEY